jgi:hypothetical protein
VAIKRTRLSDNTKEFVIHAVRHWVFSQSTEYDDHHHIQALSLLINGANPGASSCLRYINSYAAYYYFISIGKQMDTYKIIRDEVRLIHITKLTNLVRRAIGKGGEFNTGSMKPIAAFNNWDWTTHINASQLNKCPSNPNYIEENVIAQALPTRSTTKCTSSSLPLSSLPLSMEADVLVDSDSKQPNPNTLNIIHEAFVNAEFTACELLLTKYTIPEFLDRLGLTLAK